MITAVARKSDGLLADIQNSPNMPADPKLRIANAIQEAGGVAGDWALVVVPDAVAATFESLARQFVTADKDIVIEVSQGTPPKVISDKAQIENDDTDTATITCTVSDDKYAGLVLWRLIAPDGTQVTAEGEAVAGVATLELTTTQEGAHTVQASTVLHGVGQTEVEGI